MRQDPRIADGVEILFQADRQKIYRTPHAAQGQHGGDAGQKEGPVDGVARRSFCADGHRRKFLPCRRYDQNWSPFPRITMNVVTAPKAISLKPSCFAVTCRALRVITARTSSTIMATTASRGAKPLLASMATPMMPMMCAESIGRADEGRECRRA